MCLVFSPAFEDRQQVLGVYYHAIKNYDLAIVRAAVEEELGAAHKMPRPAELSERCRSIFRAHQPLNVPGSDNATSFCPDCLGTGLIYLMWPRAAVKNGEKRPYLYGFSCPCSRGHANNRRFNTSFAREMNMYAVGPRSAAFNERHLLGEFADAVPF